MRLIGSGFTSHVYRDETNRQVRRIFRNDSGLRYAQRTLPALAAISAGFPIATPWPIEVLEASESLPFGGTIARWLDGTPLTPDTTTAQIVDQLIEVVAALHRLDPERLPGADLLPRASDNGWDGLRASTTPVLAQRLNPRQISRLNAWWDEWIATSTAPHLPQAICHGDLWHENILIDAQGQVSALLDWDALRIDDPAHDVVALESLGAHWLRVFFDRWYDRLDLDEGSRGKTWRRVQLGLPARHFGGLHYSIRYHDEEELEDSVGKLEATGVWS